MGILKAVLSLSVFLLIINVSFALESYDIQYNIVNNKIVVQSIITADQSETISLFMPEDTETIELYINSIKTDAVLEDNSLILRLNQNDKVELGYITSEYIDKTNFLLTLPVNNNIKSLKITLVLPEEAVLTKPIKDTTGSIYPRPDSATTDGRSLIFAWEKTNLKPGDEISIFAMYKTKANYVPFIAAIAIIFLIALFYVLKKTKKEAAKGEKEKPDLLEHLKEEEQQIVKILKQRDNQCEQGTLRVITGFSKAHLSRLLMELEARKIIYKEKRGKKNLIFLK